MLVKSIELSVSILILSSASYLTGFDSLTPADMSESASVYLKGTLTLKNISFKMNIYVK